MTKRDIERAAQEAIADAEAAMDAIEASIDENIDAVMNVIGPEEAAHWLRSIASHIEHLSDCKGEA